MKIIIASKSRVQDWLLTGLVLLTIVFGTKILLGRVVVVPLEAAYYEGSPTWSMVTNFSWKRIVLLLGLFCFCLFLQWRERITISSLNKLAATLLVVAITIQAYGMGLLDYNHYFNNWWIADRAILLGLGVLAIFRPLFIPFFAIHLILMTGQHRFPAMIGLDHVHKYIAVPILLYFWTYLVVTRFVKVKQAGHLAILPVMALLSLWYINAGIGKIEIGWQEKNSLYYLFAAATDAGWLSEWPRAVKVWMGDQLLNYRDFLLWSTLVLEIVLPLLLFVNRTTALVASLSLFIFHLFVYLFSGILFWQWSLLEVTFIVFLVFRQKDLVGLFSWRNRVAYWSLLLAIPFTVHIGKLSWFDCGYINLYTFYLLDDSGKERKLDATYFSPYDTGFAKNRFFFTTEYATIANTYGQCNDPELLELIEGWGAYNADDNRRHIEEFRSRKGLARYDEKTATEFFSFLRTFINNKNAYDPKVISYLSVPPHMQQGEDHRNLQVPGLARLKITYEEKAILPGLEYYPVRRDSFFLPLN